MLLMMLIRLQNFIWRSCFHDQQSWFGMTEIHKSGAVYLRIARVVMYFVAFVILNLTPVISDASEIIPKAIFNVGYQVLDLKYLKDEQVKTLTVAVWYPTSAKPKPHNYGGPTEGKIAVGAAPLNEDSPYPFLVFSHGYGGSGLGAVFFTEALAAHGWIVACPDHYCEDPIHAVYG